MAEKFRKIVNAPHKAFGNVRKNIARMQPATKKGKAAKYAGVGMAGIFQFLLWATKYVALDNHLTRAMEKSLGNMTVGKNKDGKDKKLSAFAKKYPNLSSHMLYYMMLAGMIAGGSVAYDVYFANEEDAQATENNIGIDVTNIPVYEENTYGAYMAKMQPITPMLIAHLVSLEGVRMDAQGRHVAYDDANGKILNPGDKVKGKATIGFGSTRLKDGTSVSSYTPPISSAEAYELARHHLEVGETYFVLYCYEMGLGSVHFDTTEHAMMVASMVYNMGSSLIEEKDDKNHIKRFEQLRALYSEYGFGVPDDKVRELFEKYPVVNPTSFGKVLLGIDNSATMGDRAGMYLKSGGKLAAGLVYRRWIEAGLLSGDIKPIEILDVPIDGLPEFYKIMCREVGGDKKKAFFMGEGQNRRVNKSTYAKFHQWLANPVDKNGRSMAGKLKISDVLPENIVQMCRSGQCNVGNITAIIRPAEQVREEKADTVSTNIKMSVEESTYVIGYDQKYNMAVNAFRRGEYQEAAAQFETLVAEYPGNALLHNDLAATYNKLGRYDDSIEHARIILNEIGDKSQYAAAQYNAGFAYEKKGNLQKALANYKLALANGNRRVQKDITRVSRLLKANQKGRGKKSSRTAYVNGAKKLENNAHSADFDARNLVHDGHGMA